MKPNISYHALEAEEKDGRFNQSVKTLKLSDLPDHDVLVRVHYSSLNYKDSLSATGHPGVTKNYPHTPGIDAAGVVERSSDDRFKAGDHVIVTSYDLGMNTQGGFGQFISVPGDWIVPLPEGLSLKESMMIGTSGLTAAIGIDKIVRQEIKQDDGHVLVTGATGAVGSFAVALFSHLGYHIDAATGKADQKEFLEKLGAKKVIPRQEVVQTEDKLLLNSRWIAAVDTVGANYLDAILRQTAHNGVVTCCGNVLGHELHTNIYPFILRGVSLMGIDSGICLMKDRKRIWDKLATSWKIPSLSVIVGRECSLEDLPDEIELMQQGKQTGKVLVSLPD
jgi:putative YhdH/YhfP family quinone oxidoreductase